jgi:hypothetical protein
MFRPKSTTRTVFGPILKIKRPVPSGNGPSLIRRENNFSLSIQKTTNK